jgi:hypothetical protein
MATHNIRQVNTSFDKSGIRVVISIYVIFRFWTNHNIWDSS